MVERRKGLRKRRVEGEDRNCRIVVGEAGVKKKMLKGRVE